MIVLSYTCFTLGSFLFAIGALIFLFRPQERIHHLYLPQVFRMSTGLLLVSIAATLLART